MALARGGAGPRDVALNGITSNGTPKTLATSSVNLPSVPDLVARPPQASADDLLAEELRHERPQADDMRHRVAVPALGEHAHADDAAHVAAGRVQRPLELLGQILESFGVDRSALPSLGQAALPTVSSVNRIQRDFIALGLAGVGLVDHLGIDADRVDFAVLVAEAVDLAGGMPVGALSSASHS